MIQRAAVKWKRKRILFFPVLDPAEEQSGFEMRNTCGRWQGMTLGLEGGDVHRNAGSKSKLIAVKSSSGAICNLPQSLPEKIVPARALLGQPRSTYCREAQRCEMGWGDIFGLHQGDISGRGLERNGSAAQADNCQG